MGSDPKTEAGRHYVATMFGRERSNVFSVTQTEAKMKAAIRRIEDEAAREAVEWQATDAEFQAWEARHPSARLVSPADREGQVAGIAAELFAALANPVPHGAPSDGYRSEWLEWFDLAAERLYDAGLRLGQRADAPLDAELLARAIEAYRPGMGTVLRAEAIAAEYTRLRRESKP